MAESKKTADESVLAGEPSEKEKERGFGVFPNDDYSLRTGPDSPDAIDEAAGLLEQRGEELKASRGDNS